MANPFPGMDPYLEGDLWPSVHANLATELTRYLQPRLGPKYVAITTNQVVLTAPGGGLGVVRWPDVDVVSEARGGAATAVAATAPLIANALPAEEVPQYGVEIRDVVGRRLVTAIEILSPSNKRGAGASEYDATRQQIMAGGANLVEVDLHRGGNRFPLDRPLPSVAYFVFVARMHQRPQVEIWPIPLAAPLPTVTVPLDPGDADVPVDLGGVLNRLHDEMQYFRSLDYSKPPPGPPLSVEELAWIDDQLRAAGKRA